jgi:hypothetical protein
MRVPQPPNEEPSNLARWLPPEEPIEEGPTARMMLFGYARNVMRHAEAWGPHLISELVRAGALEAEGDPLEALQILIARARCSACRKVECLCDGFTNE